MPNKKQLVSSEPCIFCKIIRKEIPCYKVYEDDYVLAFLDIKPVNQGHILVIPKQHYDTILDMPTDLLKQLINIVYKSVAALQKGLDPDGFNIIQNNGLQAGQLIPHVHFHVIPRFEGDESNFGFLWGTKKLDDKTLKDLQSKLSKLII